MRISGSAKVILFCVLLLLSVRRTQAVEVSETVEAVRAAAIYLVLGQAVGGPLDGSWAGEEAHTGSIVAGLAKAHEMTGDEDARIAAVRGGDFILRAAEGNYYGDEVYALMCLSRISADDVPNIWWSTLDAFYRTVSHQARGGTPGYTSQFGRIDPSLAVFYLAQHVVAAFYVDAEDKEIWQEALVDCLIQVDDGSSEFPVMALGMATWALSQIDRLDGTVLDPYARGVSYWRGHTFGELPQLLLSHRILDGRLAGSFYWRFDHRIAVPGGPAGGYTEESTSSALGLAGARHVSGDPEIALASEELHDLLLRSVEDDGRVRQHLTLGGQAFYSEAGRVLQALVDLANAAADEVDEQVDDGGQVALSAYGGRDACPAYEVVVPREF